MVKCTVPGCNRTDSGNYRCFMFTFPSKQDLLQKWLEAIPSLKPPVKKSWRVCQNHFEPEDIIDAFCHKIGEEVFKLERERPKLRRNAVPAKNLHATEKVNEVSKANTKKQLEQHEDAPTHSKRKKVQLEEDVKSGNTSTDASEVDQSFIDDGLAIYTRVLDISDEEQVYALEQRTEGSEKVMRETRNKEITENSDVASTSRSMEEEEDPFESLFDNVFEVVLPSTLWGVHRSTNQKRIMFVCIDEDELNISKMLTVDNTGYLQIYISANLIREVRLPADILTTEHISDLLTELDTKLT